MSNTNTIASLSTIDERLFTEVTSEQAATIEGGLQVQVIQIKCLKAGADSDSSDEVFVSYNGVDAGTLNGPDLTFGRPLSMRTNSVVNVASSASANGSIRVEFFDKDGSNRAAADSLGGFTVSSSGNKTQQISGSRSRYEVSFNAF
jgi:hypothetical protein